MDYHLIGDDLSPAAFGASKARELRAKIFQETGIFILL